jgi:predicted unusual protein kinase regulating ubiquinone biosynthesis (AarF/ABC1/UbiB family)
MDTIAGHLRKVAAHVTVPRSVPGLVTDRVLVMEFVDGVPLMQVGCGGVEGIAGLRVGKCVGGQDGCVRGRA